MYELIKFHAVWCAPCKALGQFIGEVAVAHGTSLIEVDVDANQDQAAKYSIRSIPTVVLTKDGVEVGRLSKIPNRKALEDFLTKSISPHV